MNSSQIPFVNNDIFDRALSEVLFALFVGEWVSYAEKSAKEKAPLNKGAVVLSKSSTKGLFALYSSFVDFLFRASRNGRNVIVGEFCVAKHGINPVVIPLLHLLGKLFFFGLGDRLVAVNLTAFKKIHFENLPVFVVDPLFQIYISLGQKVLGFDWRERFKPLDDGEKMFLELISRKNVLQSDQSYRHLGRNLRNFTFIEDVIDIHNFQNERKSNFVEIFRVVWVHDFLLNVPWVLAVVNDNRHCRDILLVSHHNLKPILDKLWNKVCIGVTLVFFDKAYQKFSIFSLRLVSNQLQGKGDVACAGGDRVTEGFGNFLQGIYVHCSKKLSEIRIPPCRKLQKFRRAGRIFQKGTHIRVVSVFGHGQSPLFYCGRNIHYPIIKSNGLNRYPFILQTTVIKNRHFANNCKPRVATIDRAQIVMAEAIVCSTIKGLHQFFNEKDLYLEVA